MGELRSNPGQGYLYFQFTLMPIRKEWILLFSQPPPMDKIIKQIGLFNLGREASIGKGKQFATIFLSLKKLTWVTSYSRCRGWINTFRKLILGYEKEFTISGCVTFKMFETIPRRHFYVTFGPCLWPTPYNFFTLVRCWIKSIEC